MRSTGDPGSEPWLPAEANVQVSLATSDISSLASLFGQSVPDLGAMSAKARLRREGEAVRITELSGVRHMSGL